MLDKKDKKRIQLVIDYLEEIAKQYDEEGKMMPLILLSILEDLEYSIK